MKTNFIKVFICVIIIVFSLTFLYNKKPIKMTNIYNTLNAAKNQNFSEFSIGTILDEHDLFELKCGKNTIGRKEFIQLVSGDKTVLEIGPFHSPLFVSGENVKYFDVLDSEGLRKWGSNSPLHTAEGVPPKIHYVSENGNLKIIKEEKFDYVFSSHNIEHQLDLILHLNDVYDLLKTNGKYLLMTQDQNLK